jgi:hypothetical protein
VGRDINRMVNKLHANMPQLPGVVPLRRTAPSRPTARGSN